MDNAEPIRLFSKKEEKKADEKKEAEAKETEAKEAEEAEEAEEKEADEEKTEEGQKELTPEEEKKVSGGFGDFPRVPDYDYDDSVKGKV